MKRSNEMNIKTKVVLGIIIVLAVLAIIFIPKWGPGKGKGNGNGDAGTPISEENTPEPVNDTKSTNAPTMTPAPKEFSVIVEGTEILFNNEKFSSMQNLVENIKGQVEDGESIRIILHDENAIVNTWESIKNVLEKNGILWTTPTPVPVSNQ